MNPRALQASRTVSAEKSGQNRKVSLTQEVSVHEGPLPSPADLEYYETLMPGAAERLLVMAEKEQAHRHSTVDRQVAIQQQVFTADRKNTKRGQWLAFALALVGYGTCIYAATIGQAVLAGVVIATATTAICAPYLVGSKAESRSNQRPEKSA